MSENAAVLVEERKAPSPEISKPVSDPEIEECLAFVKSNKPEVVAAEMARYRREAVLGGRDFLTGLLTRGRLMQEMSLLRGVASRSEGEILVGIVDLDDLKAINDSQGHPQGDKLIIDAAQCLLRTTRGTDLVARMGGDEFALLALMKKPEDAGVVEGNVRKGMGDIRASMGFTLWGKEETFDEVYERADKLMYKEKRERKKVNA